MIITNAGTAPNGLRVNNEGQALTLSETQTLAAHNTEAGRTFTISSGFASASATADTTSAALFVRNDSTTKNLYFGHFRTCGEVAFKWLMKTGATGLSSETAITPQNNLVGDPTTLDATVYIGAQDATVTGGAQFATWINNTGHSQPDNAGAFILKANQTMTLEVIPFGSVTNGSEACITIEVWQD